MNLLQQETNKDQLFWTVIYDQGCWFCLSLKKIMEKLPHFQRNYSFLSQAEFAVYHPNQFFDQDKLHLLRSDGIFLSGTKAWEQLIKEEPFLKKFLWMAEKIGIAEKPLATFIEKSGLKMRRLCLSCYKRPR